MRCRMRSSIRSINVFSFSLGPPVQRCLYRRVCRINVRPQQGQSLNVRRATRDGYFLDFSCVDTFGMIPADDVSTISMLLCGCSFLLSWIYCCRVS